MNKNDLRIEEKIMYKYVEEKMRITVCRVMKNG